MSRFDVMLPGHADTAVVTRDGFTMVAPKGKLGR